MSGGVDSAVTAWLMKERGYECIGVTMHLQGTNGEDNACCSSEDILLAADTAEKIGIPHKVVDFSEIFQKTVIDDFIRTYCEGGTPNPCVVCNRVLKFGMLLQLAKELDADVIATGHYARCMFDEERNRHLLLRAKDNTKDQSYVLYTLSQEQLAHTVFPLGEMTKTEVRAIAEKNGFANAKRRDSQDICFVPDGDYAAFIERETKQSFPVGNFVDKEGRVLGQHRGLIRYTVGQRKGLGLSLPAPLYVAEKCVQDNSVLLTPEADLFSDTLIARDVNLIAVPDISEDLRIFAKVRYRQNEQPATVTKIDDTSVCVVFDAPQRAIAKGQSVVFYDGDIVVGGGRIC